MAPSAPILDPHELQFRTALDRLFRAFHNCRDPITRLTLATYLADFPGHVWVPEADAPHVLREDEVTTERVVLRAPATLDAAMAMAAQR